MNIKDAAYKHEDAFLKTLTDIVMIETPTSDKAACDKLADYFDTTLQASGWQVERIVKTNVGDQLIAKVNGNGGKSSLILTHYDTVWPIGTIETMPHKRDGDIFFGPGIFDMKAGIALAIHAVQLAKEQGLALSGDVTLLLTSDEEVGSGESRDLIEKLAVTHDQVLVLEPSREDGAFKIGRKGVGGYTVNFSGIPSHAGNNPKDGASAIRELAHFLLFVEDLADDDLETTANLTVASGGSTGNVIAETAQAYIDLRVLKAGEDKRVDDAVRAYVPKDSRVKVEVNGGLNRPPLEPTDKNKALFEEAKAHAASIGVDLQGCVVGGGSDGNFTSAMGIPTLDGAGAAGRGPHARDEQIRVKETLDRLAILTLLLTK